MPRHPPTVCVGVWRALAQFMIDFDIGVIGLATYELQRIDSEYHAEE